MRRYPPAPGLLLLLASSLVAVPRAQAAPAVAATKSRLVKLLDARITPEGATFYLRTAVSWHSGSCIVRANTMVQGQVSLVKRRKDGAPRNELGLRFEPVPCYGSETGRVTPLLAALSAPDAHMADDGLSGAEMKNALTAVVTERQFMPAHESTPNFGATAAITTQSMSSAALNVENRSVGSLGLIAPASDSIVLRTGEVRDIRGVKMELPSGGTGVTTLVASRDLAFEPGTQFLLIFVPTPGVTREVAGNAGPATPAISRVVNPSAAAVPAAAQDDGGFAAAQAAIEQAELCADGCAQLESAAFTANGTAAWSLSLAAMGLRPRMDQIRVELDDDASVHFLGDDEVLVTINPHGLMRRMIDGQPWPRQIRAILLSRENGRVLKVQDWPVFDEGQYTWDLGDGRVLAHVAHDLVIYGPGLTVDKHYRLPGPLVLAEVAPFRSAHDKGETDGLLAVATIREKHTREEHQKLVSFFGSEWPIDEDYDLTVLNPALAVIGTRSLDVKPTPVALLTSGMVSMQHDHGQSWKLKQEAWDGKSETLRHLSSGCGVALTSMPGPLLFATTCSPDQASTFYWVLNTHGKLLLQGHASHTEFVQGAQSSVAGDVVAVAATDANEPIDLRIGARVADFRRLAVSVYRVADGKRLLTTQSPNGSALRQTFALAPSGNSLAVLSGSTLQLYGVGSQKGPALEAAKLPNTR